MIPLHKELATVRLGEGLARSGRLSQAAMARGAEALSRFAASLASHAPLVLRACGTHALRRAANREEFLAMASGILGCRVEVISGEEEAALSQAGVCAGLGRKARQPLLLADVGGGSTELLAGKEAGGPPAVKSLPLGAVALSEEFGAAPDAMLARIATVLGPGLKTFPGRLPAQGSPFVVGCGGTATSLAALALGLREYDERRVQNFILPLSRLTALIAELAALPVAVRNTLPGLDLGRGEIIVAGALIYQELLRLLGCPELVVSDAGLLEGILLSAREKSGERKTGPDGPGPATRH